MLGSTRRSRAPETQRRIHTGAKAPRLQLRPRRRASGGDRDSGRGQGPIGGVTGPLEPSSTGARSFRPELDKQTPFS